MRFGRVEILMNVLFWGLMTWLIVYGNASMDIQSIEIVDGKKHKTLLRNELKVQALWMAQLFFIGFFYLQLFLINQLRKPKAVTGFVFKSIGLILVTFLSYLIFFAFNFRSEINFGELDLPLIITFYAAVVFCYGFTKKWIRHESDRKQLELVKKQTELSLLKQQLQPHFLFNTMNNLLAMVNQADNPKLAESIDKLSGLLRYVVYDTIHQKVSIQKELDFINNYAELHLLRYEEEEIDFRFFIHGEHQNQRIEPGILLCYVENAFKHGVQPEEKAFIHMNIDLSDSSSIFFEIENSLPQNAWKENSGGLGMNANLERLELIYPNQYALSVKEGETFQVRLKIISE